MKSAAIAATGGLIAGFAVSFIPLAGAAHVDGGNAAAWFFGLWMLVRIASGKPGHTVLAAFAGYAAALAARSAWNGCLSADGLLLFAGIPLSAMAGARTLGLAASTFHAPRRAAVAAWLLLATGGFLFIFYRSPGVSYLHPLLGWWPGPVYEGAVQAGRRELLFFGLHAAAAFGLGAGLQRLRQTGSKRATGALYVLVPLGLIAAFNPGQTAFDRGFPISARAGIAAVHAAPGVDGADARATARYADRQIADLRRKLGLDSGPPDTVHVYLYAHAWQKRDFTGAFRTSYVPVWLARPQVHITLEDVPGTLRHELVHAVLKPAGNFLFGASWNAALIEGSAVALAPDVSNRFTIDQLVKHGGESTRRIESLAGLTGFYTGRGGLSYTMAGSFVRHLITTRGAGVLVSAYASGDLEAACGASLADLRTEWQAYLDALPPDSGAAEPARRIFSAPSLLERPCARTESPDRVFLQRFEQIRRGLLPAAQLDTAGAGLSARPALWNAYARAALRRGRPLPDLPRDSGFTALLLAADERALAADSAGFFRTLERAFAQLRSDPDSAAWYAASAWRLDQPLRGAVLTARYRPDALDGAGFALLPPAEQERWLSEQTPGRLQAWISRERTALTASGGPSGAEARLTLAAHLLAAGLIEDAKRYLPDDSPRLTLRDRERRAELIDLFTDSP